MEQFEQQWQEVEKMLAERFGKQPDMEAILFLIGMNELGKMPNMSKWSKEQKQDLMHVAVCHLLSLRGYFEFVGLDEEGWPHYEKLFAVEVGGTAEQEQLLKECIIQYFAEN